MSEDTEREEIDHDYHPLLKEASTEADKKDLSFWEVIAQAFSLVFSLQKGSGLKRAADLLETNPKSIILAGIVSMIIFFTICFTASQLVIAYLTR